MTVRQDLLPDKLSYMPKDLDVKIVRIDIKAAGRVEVGGEEMEFQDVRVYTRVAS
jgi:hypothetical protein